ncbi:MAG: hypothetical protein CMP39_04360 [Rickettsiales bacterium]|nr:hypothetical protein [Rickettsiales bacterium]
MPSANSRNEPLIDFAADIAKSANMLLQVDGSYLRVINKIQTTSAIETVVSPELLDLQVAPSYPIKKIFSEFEFNTPYPNSQTLAQETKHIAQSNLSFGEEIEFDALTTSDEKVLQFLRAILITESSPIATARIFGVKTNYSMGNRVKCFDQNNNLQATVTITKIVYQFDDEATTISGPSSLEFIRSV